MELKTRGYSRTDIGMEGAELSGFIKSDRVSPSRLISTAARLRRRRRLLPLLQHTYSGRKFISRIIFAPVELGCSSSSSSALASGQPGPFFSSRVRVQCTFYITALSLPRLFSAKEREREGEEEVLVFPSSSAKWRHEIQMSRERERGEFMVVESERV